jgi:SAM-dependent methyltransferase
MARDYLEHRPFPEAITAQLIASGGITAQSHILDLASGPGSLALQLAAVCPHVTIMELSRGFCAAAQAAAAERGLALQAINESCNRLPHHDSRYDAITISQALHWLDQAAVCRGVGRTLAPGGSFFVIDASISLPAVHPLSYILGDRTPLGDKSSMPFADQAAAQFTRLDHLFKGLGTGIAGAELRLYRQARPIGEGFARAFLSDRHIAALDQDRAAFWDDLAARCAAAPAESQIGGLEWAVLQFRHGAAADALPSRFEDIPFP